MQAAGKRQKRTISGWLVLDKPYDMTSTQAVGKVRWLFAAAKAGHAGTLDPLATGILPIALGEATKAVPHVQDGRKVYRFEVRWGSTTSTDDAEGEVVAVSDRRPAEAEILAALPQFTGTIEQVPPTFSAIKVGGERAYDLARAGEAVELKPREIAIDSLGLVAHDVETSTFEVTCGKGTYVRALARDLAERLGTRGHVARLHRAAVGDFHDADAVRLADLEAMSPAERDAVLKPVAAGLGTLCEVRVRGEQATTLRNGNPVLLTGGGAPVALDAAWASFAGEVVATGSVVRGQFVPRRVFNL
ncbi:tRNA pseudouridine(55) synthase TruB [Devosia nitrariae]|uniref:tRNA pseudouridine synthase B n=1 Tax=Devosia nitrariae TaxID=2071872 RepID=A0ABQ5W840_9HYPH|nr:tRNA pseudouridine(55) synthase TruB [Devosia nitrariae]GLQ55999.1 tRNA pseudouridine synthase B [Devosia nitrariae]